MIRPPIIVSSPVSTSVIDQGSASGPVYGQIVFAEIDGDVGHVKEVVDEIFFDHVAAVAEADDEFVDAVGRVDFHDVPKNSACRRSRSSVLA